MNGKNIVIKVFSIIMHTIFPNKWSEGIDTRIQDIEKACTSNIELRVFWHVLFLPIVLPVSLFIALVKSAFIFVSPRRYNDFRYILNQMYTDVIIDRRNLKVVLKRASLMNELFVKGAEKRVTYGEENPDKTFYVLRPHYYLSRNELISNVSNLMMHYYRNLQNLAYAVEKGWIPVVDWQNYGPFPHEENYPVNGTTNCWEYYWNQPSQYSLDEVYRSKNVILSLRNTRDNQYVPSAFFTGSMQLLAKNLAIKCPKYDQLITFNDNTETYIEEKQKKLFPEDARILGVSVRGTSYGVDTAKTDVKGHPIQPSVKQLIRAIETTMDDWNMDYVFFACELDSIVDAVSAKFKDKVIILPRLRYSHPPERGDVEKGLDLLYVPGQKYQTNLDYVTEMALLSRCTSLLAAMSGGVRVALIWNKNEYENVRIIDNGNW